MSPLLETLLQALPDRAASGPLPSVQITQVTADFAPGAAGRAVRGRAGRRSGLRDGKISGATSPVWRGSWYNPTRRYP
ncbi:MAG: hypothetical protein V9H69_00125 [Anaerolineae bacterium]